MELGLLGIAVFGLIVGALGFYYAGKERAEVRAKEKGQHTAAH